MAPLNAGREEWQTIIRKGDFEHNVEILKSNEDGEIADLRSATSENNEKNPCPRFKTLHKHLKECKRTKTGTEDHLTQPLASSRALLGMAVSDGCFEQVYRLLLANMHRVELHLVIRNDEERFMSLAQLNLQHKDDERHSDIRCVALLRFYSN